MANWLLDYIEMTEYIPLEFRDQTFTMRELDLKVKLSMSQLEADITKFFSKIDTMSPKEKQDEYEELVKRFDEASVVANTKVKIADRLHDMVEKSMRLLDQGLEKLKEDLIEGDKAYIVEDIERRSQELDDQLLLEEATLMQPRQHKVRDSKATSNHYHHSKGSHVNNNNAPSNHRLSNHHISHNSNHTSAHINYTTTQHYNKSNPHHHYNHNRYRTNSTGGHESLASNATSTPAVKQKKRERKRLNSAMTIFNRNSKTDDDSTNQTSFLSSPTTPDYLANLHSSNSNSLNDVSGGDASCHTKGMAGNKHLVAPNDKSNGNDPLSKARQPILSAIDAAHAVSPNATNSDKLVLLSNNSNGDNYNNSNYMKDKHVFHQNQMSQLSNHLLSPAGLNSGHNLSNINGNNKFMKGDGSRGQSAANSPFASLSRHDPIMMAASQAIHATQNMTPGRRTSSLKASYAAVNSGRLQHPNNSNHSMFDRGQLANEKVYCRCRGTVQDLNMIACDNVNCKFEWFHYQCVGITTPPPGEWYCEDCRDLPRTAQEQAANSSKHQQSRQAVGNLLQTADNLQRGETSS